MRSEVPLLEFDDDPSALIEPIALHVDGPVPERAVICFFREVIEQACGDGRAEVVSTFQWSHGDSVFYRLRTDRGDVGVFHPGVGAPLACGLLEDAIASGCRKFVACGGAGALVPELALGHVIVPTAAIRDEGTSYHYLPAEREIAVDPRLVDVVTTLLDQRGIPYVTGKSWTTDAPYRETRAKIAARRDEGCISVEMELAAFLAVAAHRGVELVQYLYAGDDASGDAWDHRHWHTSSAREDLFWLAIDTALLL